MIAEYNRIVVLTHYKLRTSIGIIPRGPADNTLRSVKMCMCYGKAASINTEDYSA